jgi:serine protease Do
VASGATASVRTALALLGGALLGAVLAWGIVRSEPAQQDTGIHSQFARLAERARTGIVNVHTRKTMVRPGLAVPDVPLPPGFRDFFGPRGGEGGPRVAVPSLGSGFVISDEGLIVTNNHVVDGVDRVQVVLSDGTQVDATIVGQDPQTDLALIRIERVEGLEPLPLGDSDEILPGDWVVAIGNPFGLDHTVTVGIVSAKNRDIGHGSYDDYIQTDAAMNPGNSGGPLLNMRGEVVGINAAINPEANTIGFAIPINLAKEILPQLRTMGRVTRGWLGVGVQPLTPEIAMALGLASTRGALVSQIRPGSPAAVAGIERGDVIVAYRGQEIEDLRSLPRAVSATEVGEQVELELIRDGERWKVEARVGELAELRPAAAPAPAGPGVGRYGFEVREPAPGEPGVIVFRVEADGAAAEAGLRPGDVLLEANRRPLRGIEDLAEVLEQAEDGTLLLVERSGSTVFVVIDRSR